MTIRYSDIWFNRTYKVMKYFEFIGSLDLELYRKQKNTRHFSIQRIIDIICFLNTQMNQHRNLSYNKKWYLKSLFKIAICIEIKTLSYLYINTTLNKNIEYDKSYWGHLVNLQIEMMKFLFKTWNLTLDHKFFEGRKWT